MIRIFIGYDENEIVAAHVLHQSIIRFSSMPVSVSFINRRNLTGIFTRSRGPLDSTDFSISRFLVPYLCGYEGHAVFMDCDMVCRDDVSKLWAWRDDIHAVRVVKHNYAPEEETKFLDQPQTKYSFKNWSSVMLFNNAKCKSLTLNYVNTAQGLDLHQFKWIENMELIGDLPHGWNHLVGWDKYDPMASLAHFTSGGPYFEEFKNVDYHQDWHTNMTDVLHASQRKVKQ